MRWCGRCGSAWTQWRASAYNPRRIFGPQRFPSPRAMVHPGHPAAPRSAPPSVDRAAAIMRTRQLPIVAALVAIVFGVAVVQGYVFGIEPLLPYTPFLPPTQP